MSENELERNLGLIETIAICMGSMIGSGIFILPGVAYMQVGNESVVLAFLVGGLLTIPAALSAAELSTAIPESGGSYTYIQRGMGPLMGTIAGVGNWMVLNFKTALALIGGIPYLVYIFPAIQSIETPFFTPIVFISIFLTLVFTIINAVSSSSAGKVQNIIVILMIIAIGIVMVGSIPDIVNSDPTTVFGVEAGFISATSLVFVAYAGVIKVTSVAEEIENPSRNIPYGIVISLAITTFVYVVITYIAVKTVDIVYLVENVSVADGGLASDGEGAIIAIAAENIIGYPGAVMIVAAALLALASTANSGILSASRYPLAMARDKLANKRFGLINDKTGTPIYSVLATGGAVIFMVSFLPVDSVARFGAAFQIIVFMLVSISVIGFRESSPEEYNPTYLSPFYPYLQIFGLLSGLMLLARIGAVALIGSVIIVIISIAYYYISVKEGLETEGSVKEGFRKEISQTTMNRTKNLLAREGRYKVMVALWEDSEVNNKERLLNVVKTLSSHGLDVKIDVVSFEESMKTSLDEDHPTIDRNTPSWVEEYSNVEYKKVNTRNIKRSIVEYATYNDIDLVSHHYKPDKGRVGVLDDKLEWVLENAPCESILIKGDSSKSVDKVTAISTDSVYIPVKILVADSIANAHNAHLEIISLKTNPSEQEIDQVREYLNELQKEIISKSSFEIIETDDIVETASKMTSDSDVLITELDINTLYNRLIPSKSVKTGLQSDSQVVFAYSDKTLNYQTIYNRLIMKYLFRGLK